MLVGRALGGQQGGADSKASAVNVLLAGRRKKTSGRKKAPSRLSAKSRSSGARLKKRPGRVKKRKAQKIKVVRDGGLPRGVLRPVCGWGTAGGTK